MSETKTAAQIEAKALKAREEAAKAAAIEAAKRIGDKLAGDRAEAIRHEVEVADRVASTRGMRQAVDAARMLGLGPQELRHWQFKKLDVSDEDTGPVDRAIRELHDAVKPASSPGYLRMASAMLAHIVHVLDGNAVAAAKAKHAVVPKRYKDGANQHPVQGAKEIFAAPELLRLIDEQWRQHPTAPSVVDPDDFVTAVNAATASDENATVNQQPLADILATIAKDMTSAKTNGRRFRGFLMLPTIASELASVPENRVGTIWQTVAEAVLAATQKATNDALESTREPLSAEAWEALARKTARDTIGEKTGEKSEATPETKATNAVARIVNSLKQLLDMGEVMLDDKSKRTFLTVEQHAEAMKMLRDFGLAPAGTEADTQADAADAADAALAAKQEETSDDAAEESKAAADEVIAALTSEQPEQPEPAPEPEPKTNAERTARALAKMKGGRAASAKNKG